jgi:hypothetical protein
MVVAFVGMLAQAGAAGADQPVTPDARQAQEALRSADEAVRRAESQRSLWTTAAEALELARTAAARGDYRVATQAARFAAEQAELGMAQRGYPRFEQ